MTIYALPGNPTLQPTHTFRASVLSPRPVCFCYRPSNVPFIAAGKQEIVRGSKLGGKGNYAGDQDQVCLRLLTQQLGPESGVVVDIK